MTWHPILSDARVGEILAAIEKDTIDAPSSLSAKHRDRWDGCLATGAAGVGMFAAHAGRALDNGPLTNAAARLLEEAIAEIGDGEPSALKLPRFFTGFPGVAWTMQHVSSWLYDDPSDEDINEDPDAALAELVETWSGGSDLYGGLVGVGVYALERANIPTARQLVCRVVEILDARAVRADEGVTWNGPGTVEHVDVGAAHGVAGIIAFLAHAEQIDEARLQSSALLDGAFRWLWQQSISDEPGRQFPHRIGRSGIEPPSTFGWCHGDLGIAATVLAAAQRSHRDDDRKRALELACAAARCSVESTSVDYAGLCHGAAGAAHLFNRIYQDTGVDELRAAAAMWFARTLEMWTPGTGVGGYRCPGPADSHSRLVSEVGLLSGAAGIGLALLAASTSVEPVWDRFLLVS